MPTTSRNSHRVALGLLAGAEFDRGLSIERQIASQVRRLILSEALPADTRVPPIRALAELWGTNYFTVQSALRSLVREGLLVQSPRLGTFVAGRKRRLLKACLYHGEDLRFRGASEFFGRLHLMTYQLLAARGVHTVSYFDHRPEAERMREPAEIRDLIKGRQADAVIATTTHPDWLNLLDVPVASLRLAPERGGVGWDVESFARLAVQAATEAGARSLGVIARQLPGTGTAADARDGESNVKPVIESAAAKAGLKVVEVPGPDIEGRPRSIEETGFLWGERVAGMSPRPEALVVFPDSATRGIVSAFLKHGVRVPDELLLISHRNHEMPFFTPFPVTWLTVKIEDYAQTLLAQIDAQIAGGRAERARVRVTREGPPRAGRAPAGRR